MREFYSSGAHGEVFRIPPGSVFPHSDLVRTEYEVDRYWFLRLFYRQKIAKLLFSENFIEVVGTKVSPVGDGVSLRTHSLFSKTAQVDPDHAIFSAHMTMDEKNIETWGPACKCETCVLHRRSHQEQLLMQRAGEIADKAQKMGIILPVVDQSDYCLSQAGNVIFFEIEELRTAILRKRLQGRKRPSNDEIIALHLLERYDSLSKASRQFASLYTEGMVKVREN